MLQDESNVRGPVEIGNHLHVMAQSVIGQLLVFGWRERLWFDQRGSAAKLEMSFQLDQESIDLVEGTLPDRPLELLHAVEMVRIIPVNLPLPQVGPVHACAFRQPRLTDVGTEQLNECHYPVEQSSPRVSSNRYAICREFDPVCLLRDCDFIAIDCGAKGNRLRNNR